MNHNKHVFFKKTGSMFLLLPVFFILLINLSSSIEVKQGSDVTVSFNCIDSVTKGYCTGTCNISLNDIQGAELNKSSRTLSEGAVSIKYSSTLFKDLGNYEAKASCTNGTYASVVNNTITIKESTSGNKTLFFILGGIAIFLTFLAIIIKDEWVGAFGGIIFVGLGLYGLVNGIDVYKNSTTSLISLLIALFGAYVILQAALEKIG